MFEFELPAWLTQPPWWLPYTVYAVLTALFGLLARIEFERYKERRITERSERVRKVEETNVNIELLRTKISTINYNLVEAVDDDLKRVNDIKFFDETPSRESEILSIAREFPDLAEIARRYVEAIREGVDWREANRKLLKVEISELVTNNFHQTLAANPHPTPHGWGGLGTLEAACQIHLINPIVKGNRISRELLEQLTPELCVQIRKLSAEDEGIEKFLRDLNVTIARNPFLLRFRGEQETIEVLGKELKKIAQEHISNVQKDLENTQNTLEKLKTAK